jgi:nonribosomal peptide synthetase DhbF
VLAVERLPLTRNGKLDRGALPLPETDAPARDRRDPRTPEEAALCQVFAEVLGVGEVGADDGFFELGGHSLLVPRLIVRAREAVGIDISMKQLFVRPTPAGLLQGRPPAKALLSPLVRLRGGGDGRPFWCVHPGSGLGWSYTALLPHIPARHPVYALQARGLDGSGALAGGFAELVEDYCDQIVAEQPRGPYLLAGWSFGGTAAHAIAVRLRGLGHEVALLAVIDSWPADGRGDLPADAEEISAVAFDGGDTVEGLGEEAVEVLLRATRNNIRLLCDPGLAPGVFDGSLLLFESAPGGRGFDAERLWRPYVAGEIRAVPVDGEHLHMMRPEALAVIGPVLSEALRSPASRPAAAVTARDRS